VKSTAALYEEIAKRAIIRALQTFACAFDCDRCNVPQCDPDRCCEEQIADVLWAREEAAS